MRRFDAIRKTAEQHGIVVRRLNGKVYTVRYGDTRYEGIRQLGELESIVRQIIADQKSPKTQTNKPKQALVEKPKIASHGDLFSNLFGIRTRTIRIQPIDDPKSVYIWHEGNRLVRPCINRPQSIHNVPIMAETPVGLRQVVVAREIRFFQDINDGSIHRIYLDELEYIEPPTIEESECIEPLSD